MRFLKADKLFNGTAYLAEDAVLVLDQQNVLKDIVPENILEKSEIERYPGILTPGFVNAHCHLELSHLKGEIAQHTGLPAFAKQVISLRHTLSKEEISSRMQQANSDMWNKGIVAVGDISNTSDSFEEKCNSKIHYHTFVELIGLNPANASVIFDKGKLLLDALHDLGLPGSLAPHAPYSTSKELIALIAEHNRKTTATLSIHNQESEEERKFFYGQPSGFDELYRSLGLDLSWYKAPGMSSLQYYVEALAESSSLLVHNTFTHRSDLQAAAGKTIFWCFCPGANRYIENQLPDLMLFKDLEKQLCIGTDSLASNHTLDVIQEVNLLLAHRQPFPAEVLLQALTANGARALGISEQYGSFIKGKNAGINLLELHPSNIRFIKKIA